MLLTEEEEEERGVAALALNGKMAERVFTVYKPNRARVHWRRTIRCSVSAWSGRPVHGPRTSHEQQNKTEQKTSILTRLPVLEGAELDEVKEGRKEREERENFHTDLH